MCQNRLLTWGPNNSNPSVVICNVLYCLMASAALAFDGQERRFLSRLSLHPEISSFYEINHSSPTVYISLHNMPSCLRFLSMCRATFHRKSFSPGSRQRRAESPDWPLIGFSILSVGASNSRFTTSWCKHKTFLFLFSLDK